MKLLFGTLLLFCCLQDSLGFIDRRRLTPYIVGKEYRWPNGKIPYTVSSRFSTTMKERIKAAIKSWNLQVEVEWIERTNEGYYVEFYPGSGCSSMVGMRKDLKAKWQDITLSSLCEEGSILHEMMHATGFHHTHARSDRDRYVKVTSYNHNYVIPKGYADCEQYDFGSIMHYPENHYIKRIVDANGQKIGQRENLSPQDIRCINTIYGFPASPSRLCKTDPTKYKYYAEYYCRHAKDRYKDAIAKDENCKYLMTKAEEYCVKSTCWSLKPDISFDEIWKLAYTSVDAFVKIYYNAFKCYHKQSGAHISPETVVKSIFGGSQVKVVVNSTQLLVLFVVCACVAGCAFAMVFHFVGKMIAKTGKKKKYKQLSFHDEDSSSNTE